MSRRTPRDWAGAALGLVTPEHLELPGPVELVGGASLPGVQLVYETYGALAADRSNALLVCHALSGHHHAAGLHAGDERPGWWDTCIGPGKPIDTDRFFVVSLNNIGGCHGSTGPASTHPDTGQPWGPDFPVVTVRDWVAVQARLADHLGIQRWAAVVGGSLGGMQALQWAVDFPERVANAAVIAAAPRLSAQNIAFNEIARHAIQSDPDFHNGRYQQAGAVPVRGLRLARMVGHVTYQSDDGLRAKFDRAVRSGSLDQPGDEVQFQVESYLHHQGNAFSRRFDANTYILMTRALDLFDPAREYGDSLVDALAQARARFLVLSFSTDWRFPPSRSTEITDALVAAGRDVASVRIDAPQGHDAFLLPVPRYLDAFGRWLERVADECCPAAAA